MSWIKKTNFIGLRKKDQKKNLFSNLFGVKPSKKEYFWFKTFLSGFSYNKYD